LVDVVEFIVGSMDPRRRELTVDEVVIGVRLADIADGIVGRDVDTAALS
jgi:hypothetical protein